MRVDENILLTLSKAFLNAPGGLDWGEVEGLVRDVFDRWRIGIAFFELGDNGMACLKFHSMDSDFENWLESAGGIRSPEDEMFRVPVESLAAMEDALETRVAVFVPSLMESATYQGLKIVGQTAFHLPAVFAPLLDEDRPVGILAAISEDLTYEDKLLISLVAHELSMLVGKSEQIRELRESHDLLQHVASKYRNLIDRLDEYIIMANASGKILAANEKLTKALDYTYSQLLKMEMSYIVHPDDRKLLESTLDEARDAAIDFKVRLLSKDGEAILTEATLTYSATSETYQGTFRERKKAAALERGRSVGWLQKVTGGKGASKKDYELLLNSILDGFPGLAFFMNTDGKLVYISPSAEDITGYSREDFFDHPLRWLERVHPEDREKVAMAYQDALLVGEGHYNLAFKFNNKYGRCCDFISAAAPLFDAGGKLLGIEGIFHDITSIVESEREKVESVRQRSNLFEDVNDLLFVMDMNYRIQMVNSSSENLLGYKMLEMVGMKLEELIDQSYSDAIGAAVKDLLEKGEVEGVVLRAFRKNGEDVFLEINATAVMEDDKPVAVRGVARDVTERVRLEERERALQEELAQKEKMAAIGELLATVSHGIRNPLASIRAVAQSSLEELAQDHSTRINFKNIINEADRLETRIKEFLSFYRPFEPDLKYHHINGIITEALEMVAVKMKEQSIDLDLELDWEAPKVLVDFAQIEQVVLNLLGNALHVTPEGGKLFVSTSRKNDKPCDRVVVTIEDTGSGIPPNLREKVFQAFFTTKTHGTGMGLSVSKKIIVSHGGNIAAYEGRSGGARIEFWIPIHELKSDN